MKTVAIAAVTIALAVPVSARLTSALDVRQEQETVYEPGNGVVAPVAIHQAPVTYSPDAMREGVQGHVLLEGIVRRDGKVTDVRVVQALHPDLDRAATEAFAKWEFKPGRKDGRPVAVRISVAIGYSLAEKPDPVYEVGGKITAPVVVTEVRPTYPDEDRAAGRTGVVGLECIVRRNGIPSDIVVTKRLYPSLDEAAVAALKQWRFKPGARGLTDVSVRIQLTMSFNLR